MQSVSGTGTLDQSYCAGKGACSWCASGWFYSWAGSAVLDPPPRDGGFSDPKAAWHAGYSMTGTELRTVYVTVDKKDNISVTSGDGECCCIPCHMLTASALQHSLQQHDTLSSSRGACPAWRNNTAAACCIAQQQALWNGEWLHWMSGQVCRPKWHLLPPFNPLTPQCSVKKIWALQASQSGLPPNC